MRSDIVLPLLQQLDAYINNTLDRKLHVCKKIYDSNLLVEYSLQGHISYFHIEHQRVANRVYCIPKFADQIFFNLHDIDFLWSISSALALKCETSMTCAMRQ